MENQRRFTHKESVFHPVYFLVMTSQSNVQCVMDLANCSKTFDKWYIDGLVQERRNSSALAMELRASCINPSIWNVHTYKIWHYINNWLMEAVPTAPYIWQKATINWNTHLKKDYYTPEWGTFSWGQSAAYFMVISISKPCGKFKGGGH